MLATKKKVTFTQNNTEKAKPKKGNQELSIGFTSWEYTESPKQNAETKKIVSMKSFKIFFT